MPPKDYIQLVKNEIQSRREMVPYKKVSSIYFGGGTPSLLEPEYILSITREIANAGFAISKKTEQTIEINPATITPEKLDRYLEGGINRFSVGAQTFNDRLLKSCGREHDAQGTRETLKLLKDRNLNFSFDLLYGLPGQSLEDLEQDLEEISLWQPKHLSPYLLTVPKGHSMSFGRPSDQIQVEMMDAIEDHLKIMGLQKYEISNFSVPSYESAHNSCYWDDSPYWGIGLSAHSYFPQPGYGVRFWNPKNLDLYQKQMTSPEVVSSPLQLPEDQQESLLMHESLTDYCHIHLRTMKGLNMRNLKDKFGDLAHNRVLQKLQEQQSLEHIKKDDDMHYSFTSSGVAVSNKVFLELTFLSEDFSENF